MPADFDYRFFQTAPAALIRQHLRGDETVRLDGLVPGGALAFRLPGLVPVARHAWFDGRAVSARLHLDGVHLDLLLGAGNRKMRERGDRLYANDGSRLTSFGDGPAICLIGNKSTQGTPHNAAHGGDGEIQSRAADNGGVLSLGEGVDISVSHALAARPECSGEILTKTYDEFGRFDPDTPIRGTKNPIGKDSATSRLLNIVKPGTER